MARILIIGKGGYGDVFPVFAVARELKLRGHHVTIASEAHNEAAISEINVPMIQLDHKNLISNFYDFRVKSISGIVDVLKKFRLMMQCNLEDEYNSIIDEAEKSDILIGNQLAYVGSVARAKLNKKWVFCAPSPLAIPSRISPPIYPFLHWLQRSASDNLSVQILCMNIARWGSRFLMLDTIRLKNKLGINDNLHPRFEGIYSDFLNLMMTSPVVLDGQMDWPKSTVVTGFSWFNPKFMSDASQSLRLSEFIGAGSLPVLFAPGGGMRTRPGNFFRESIKAAKSLGVRAIVVMANRFHHEYESTKDVFVTGYMPYTELIPNVSAMVHSGGIGTLGLCLRFGVPSLLTPIEWDQFDNARRAERCKVASIIRRGRYNAKTAASALENLLSNTDVEKSLGVLKRIVSAENGARVACDNIETILE